MNDMTAVIIPKSDQISADDLIAGPLTITIEKVTVRPGTEQPVTINYDGDGGRPFKPCKSMARVMVAGWGPDANAYVGRALTLYRDPSVKWGGMEVGGIRISHMTDLPKRMTMALTQTKGSKKLFTVEPMAKAAPAKVEAKPAPDAAVDYARGLVARIRGAATAADLEAIIAAPDVKEKRATLADERPKLAERINAAVSEVLEGFDALPMREPGEEG